MKIVQACLDQWYQKEQQRRDERNGNDGTPDAWSAETSSDQLSTRAAAERSAVSILLLKSIVLVIALIGWFYEACSYIPSLEFIELVFKSFTSR